MKTARHDVIAASQALLGLFRIEEPTIEQKVGALLVAEFVLKVNKFLG